MRDASDVTAELHLQDLVMRVQTGEGSEDAFRRLFELYARPLSHFFANRGFRAAERNNHPV